jgi:hypothetical protein
MAASKDNDDAKNKGTDTEPKESASGKSLAGTYKLLRGSVSSFAAKETTREERLVENGPLVPVSYKKGDRIRYDASDENRNTMELTDEQARRFLNNPRGGKVIQPRVERV